MLKSLIVLPDGTELFSGVGEASAIQSTTITECVNGAQELTLGSCCANMVEAKILTPGGGVSIVAGDEIAVYRVAEDGTRHAVGLFTAEKPTRPSANSLNIVAYDRVIWLDKDLTQWLQGLDQWPYPLIDFARSVCTECGLELLEQDDEEIPNSDYLVQQFSADGITGRKLMQWVGEICGRFCRATPDGKIELAWYKPITTLDIRTTPYPGNSITYADGNISVFSRDTTVTDGDDGNVVIDSELLTVSDDGAGNVVFTLAADIQSVMYYQNGLSFEDYTVAPIQKVQLRQNEEDIGTVYPDGIAEPVNTYTITGNYLLTASTGEDLVPVAQALYEHLSTIEPYTPCKVSIPTNMLIHAGNTVKITDRNGKLITAYVMTRTQSGQRDTLECTGSARRDSSSAVNNQTFQAYMGKVLNLRTDVDGIFAQNKDTTGRVSQVELDLEGIRGKVESMETENESTTNRLTQVEQSADGLKVDVQKIQTEGATKIRTGMGYTFDDTGLHIVKEGEQMENLLNQDGMYVKRSGDTILQADATGVIATDVRVNNYLVIGEHARFEDYSGGRTACFWLGGQ